MWQPAHPFRLLQPPLILFLLHTLADQEEVGEEDRVDRGVQVAQVALAGQEDLATQVALVDTVAMAEEGLDIRGMTPPGDPSTTPCPNLRKYLAC